MNVAHDKVVSEKTSVHTHISQLFLFCLKCQINIKVEAFFTFFLILGNFFLMTIIIFSSKNFFFIINMRKCEENRHVSLKHEAGVRKNSNDEKGG